MNSTRRVWVVLSPFIIFLAVRFGAPMVAEIAPTSFVPALAATSFILAAMFTWVLVQVEGRGMTRARDHFRQASLFYLLAAVNLISPFFSKSVASCFVCPPPWAAVVIPALAANMLVLAARRVRPFAA